MGRIDGSSGNSWLRWVDRRIVVRRVEGHQRAADRTAARRPDISSYRMLSGHGRLRARGRNGRYGHVPSAQIGGAMPTWRSQSAAAPQSSQCQLFSCGRDNGICDSLVDAVGLQDVSIDGVETVQEGAVALHANITTVPQVIDGLVY